MPVLTHFARERKTIFSILEHGFVYFHNETKIILPIIGKALGITIEPTTNGMVCFTDIALEQSQKHRKKYGNYGIAVSKNWAVSKGAKRVIYLPTEGPEIETLIQQYKGVMPKLPPDLNEASRNFIATLEKMRFFTDDPSVQFLERLEWMQTKHDEDQSEWRIRKSKKSDENYSTTHNSFESFRDIFKKEKKQAIEELISLKKWLDKQHDLNFMTKQVVLELGNDAIKYFICPEDDINDFKSELMQTCFSRIPVTTVPRI